MSSLPSGPSVRLPPSSDKPHTPTIRWGGHATTLARFPHPWELQRRCESQGSHNVGTPISLFREAIVASSEQICILDLHFDEIGIIALVEALLEAPKAGQLAVRIVGPRMNRNKPDREKLISQELLGVSQPQIEWREIPDRRVFPFAHDRFCIIDDELFHFGGTVGGAMPRLTAASSGWSASDCDAYRFFNELWDNL